MNEEVKVVADDVKYSSSVVDAAWFLHRMFKVRDNLEWPVTIEVLEFTLMFMKEMIDIALVYVIDVFEKLEEGNLFDEKGQFKASPEVSESCSNSLSGLCVWLNMFVVRSSVAEYARSMV